jgi:DNA-binding transcriptional MocR family regulator
MAQGSSASAWLSQAQGREGPIYAAIVAALDEAIRAGDLHAGDRLPPQRAVAARLGVDLTTVTRAYALARDLGLVDGAVGRGTFVRARTEDDEAGLVDLTMNLPPPPQGLSLGALIAETTRAILARADPAVLMAYHPGFGSLGQRRAAAQWLAPCLGEIAPERLLVSPGAQAALTATLTTLCRPGDTVVCEPLTYPGLIGLAAHLGLRLVACESDAEGPLAAQLQTVCARERPKAVYLVPTMQNPAATTLSALRRRDLANAIAESGAWLIEDDPYSRLCANPPPAVASFRPERAVYIGTLAKTLSPGLRIAFAAAPGPVETERLAVALRATALMPAPLMAAVASAWIREGRAEALLQSVRAEAKARRALAAELLPAALGAPESLHVWLPLPDIAAAERLRLAAHERGFALVTQSAFAVGEPATPGVRLSLGGPGRRAALAAALRSVSDLLARTPTGRAVV